MHCMFSAKTTILLHLQLFRLKLFVLSGRVIPVLALSALQTYNFPHFLRLLHDFRYNARADGMTALTNSKAETFFHSNRSY